jgi:hypothetical protein
MNNQAANISNEPKKTFYEDEHHNPLGLLRDDEHSLMKAMNFFNHSNNTPWQLGQNSNLLHGRVQGINFQSFSPFHGGNFDNNSNLGPFGVTQMLPTKLAQIGSGSKGSMMGLFPIPKIQPFMEESNFTPKKLNFKGEEEAEAEKKPAADDPVEDKPEEVGVSHECTTIPHPD